MAVRTEMRTQLTWLKRKLGDLLTEREVYYCLFPLVIYFDEMIQAAAGDSAAGWTPLQRELFNVSNGGELFYESLDDLLRKDETLPLIYEVFYFCLTDGFKGRWIDEPAKIEDWKERVASRIPVPPLPAAAKTIHRTGGAVELAQFPLRYYLWAAVALFGIVFCFRMAGYLEAVLLN